MIANPDEAAAGDAFWRFSLALYARPGVGDALLRLQDGAARDVNLVLWTLWLGIHGVAVDPAALTAAAAGIAPINAATVAPLRQIRRQLRGTDDPPLGALRRRILGLELAAERQVQHRLAVADLPSATSGQEADPLGIAAANLTLYLDGAQAEPAAAVLIEALRGLTRG